MPKCPYKKTTTYIYADNPLFPSVKGTEESFGKCDEFECIAYYETMFDDDDNSISHCKRMEIYEEDCN